MNFKCSLVNFTEKQNERKESKEKTLTFRLCFNVKGRVLSNNLVQFMTPYFNSDSCTVHPLVDKPQQVIERK